MARRSGDDGHGPPRPRQCWRRPGLEAHAAARGASRAVGSRAAALPASRAQFNESPGRLVLPPAGCGGLGGPGGAGQGGGPGEPGGSGGPGSE